MEKMKQNKNNSVVIRVVTATLAAVFLFFSISIPTFAASSSSGMTLLPYDTSFSGTYMYNSQLPSNATLFYQRQISSSSYYDNIGISNQDNTYACYYMNGSTVNMAFFRDSDETFTVYWGERENSSSRCNTAISSWIPDEQNNPIVGKQRAIGGIYSSSTSIRNSEWTLFDSLDDATNAFLSFAQGAEPQEFNISISPGYALFIDIHGLSGVQGSLSTTTSKAFASPHTSNQTLSYQNALPSGNVSPQGNGISWQGNGNKDLFGRYKSWSATLIPNNYNYIAIYNPVHIDTYVDPEHEDFNGSISVHVNKAYSETTILIPLNTELTGTGTVGTVTTEDQKPVVYDETTGTWIPTNQDGTPYTPSPYGDYMPSTVNSIHDWLQNIANLISGFFNGAIGAVTTLVGAGSAFINQLVSLYSWLPAPVYAVLSSALILVITIGVIKVFI